MYYAKPRQEAPWEDEKKLTIFCLMDDLKLYRKKKKTLKKKKKVLKKKEKK